MRGTLRTLGDLFSHGTAVGLDDGQLLARYTDCRDEAAFEVLVARHGPMVLATCRAVLKHEHDVEDAFQATFFVLARKARSVRAGATLSGWLHRVAYRAAVQASVESRRRRLREAEAAMAVIHATYTETDIPSIVHEELDRLPDRQRLPVILCDLEGLTYEQAARHLRWTEPTLRHRLVTARQRLRDRLCRRGLGAGTVGGLAGSTSGARGAVPAALARSAVEAAVGGASSASAAALTNILIRSVLMTRLKIATAGLLSAAITLASIGGVAVGARRTDEPEAAKGGPGVAERTAAVGPILARAAQAEAQQASAGSGPGIEGRIVDLEGRPVAGVRVELMNLWSAPDNDLARWLDQARDGGVAYPSQGLSPGNLPAIAVERARSTGPIPPSSIRNVTTGHDGRFQLVGVGSEQLAAIRVSGPTIATSQLYVMGRDGVEVRATVRQGMTPSQVVYHTRRLEHAASPGKPIQGVVRDKDTGRPLVGITLHAALYDEHNLVPAPDIEATTDDRGFYRLIGLPRAPAYRLFVEPGAGVPYPKATLRAAGDTPTSEPVTCDITLRRGIVVRGKVADKVTGQPVSACIDVFTFEDNPHVREFPGFRSSGLARGFTDDGRYEVVALPGRGIIGVLVGGYSPRYRGQVGAKAIKGYDPKLRGFRTEPEFCMAGNYHAVAELNLDPEAESATLDLEVDPGRTIVATPIDPEGKPVSGTTVTGVNDLFSSSEYPQGSATIAIDALDPSRPRRVTVRHAGRKLVGTVYLKGDETGPLTIQLQPWGTITGRIVDENGRPRGGLGISSASGVYPERPAEQGILPGGESGDGIRIGSDGRFRIEGVVPGLKYGGGTGERFRYFVELFHDLTVSPGEVKDLGDLKVVPPSGATQ